MPGTTPPRATGPSSEAHPASSARAEPRWFAAHELRTPLQAIKGGVELLLEARGAGLRPELLDVVTLIATAAIDLERQLDLLAELSALAHAIRPGPRAVALRDLLARPEIAQALMPPATPAGLPGTVRVLVAPELLGRAMTLLAQAQSGARARLSCDCVVVDAASVRLGLCFVACGSGAGAVALRLARELLEHAAVVMSGGAVRGLELTMRRC